jgi:signal transduction histidine kinase
MRQSKTWVRFRDLVLGVSVSTKILGMILGLVVLFGMGFTIQIRTYLTKTLVDQLDRNGLSLARDLAARGSDFILTDNTFALYELIRVSVENNEDVRYIFFLDQQGVPVVHSFGLGFPAGLAPVDSLKASEEYRLEILDTEEGLIHDIGVPILGGRAGTTHVGMSERHLRNTVAGATLRFVGITVMVSFVGLGLAVLLTFLLTRPIRDLVKAAKAVGSGDYTTRARVWADDEIGHLSQGFNDMTANLDFTSRKLQEKERLLEHLLHKIMSAQEEERRRVARELHDETAQSLTSVIVGLTVLERDEGTPETIEKVGALRSMVANTLDEVHRLSRQLRPGSLDSLGLIPAVQQQIREFSVNYGIQVDFHVSGFNEQRLPSEVETCLYRIIQESLTNIAKHAQAGYLSVLLERKPSSVKAIVEDNGKGIDMDKVMSGGDMDRLGLFGMEERASLLGGTLSIESEPGAGTTVFVEIPCPPAEQSNG